MSRVTESATPQCPFNNLPCKRIACAIYDDHWRVCSLHRDSREGSMRVAIQDSFVAIHDAYMKKDAQ